MTNYTLTACRPIKGHDGQGFEATLAADGRRVAEVFDDGWGGCLEFRWQDRGQPRVEVEVIDFDDRPCTIRCTPMEAALRAHVATLPPVTILADRPPMAVSMDMFVNGLVDDELARRDCRRLLKSRTVLLIGDQISTLSGRPVPLPCPLLARKFAKPGQRFVILNELPPAEAEALYLQATAPAA